MPDFKFLLLGNYIIRHAERMQQLARRIIAHFLLPMINCGSLNDHRKITARSYWK